MTNEQERINLNKKKQWLEMELRKVSKQTASMAYDLRVEVDSDRPDLVAMKVDDEADEGRGALAD